MPQPMVHVSSLDVAAYTIPTDQPESEGTTAWESTTMVVVEADGGDATGIGYAYADTAALIRDKRAAVAVHRGAMAVGETRAAIVGAIRNLGRPGVASMAAGEHGYDAYYFARMIGYGAVDCLQGDPTRCGGFTGSAQVGAPGRSG